MQQNNLKILGIDVSKSSVSACLLTCQVDDARLFYYDCPFYHLKADASGIKVLLGLKPDVAVMEPTGVNYSRIWSTHLALAGMEVRFVGHKELRNYRENHLNLPDKDDDADSLALACYGQEYYQQSTRFVRIKEPIVSLIRDKVLRLGHLNRVQSPIINRARQDLCWQFPEVAFVKSLRGDSGEVPLLWGWLAEERLSTKYDNLYKNTCGLGLTSTVRLHAQRICSLQREEYLIECELKQILSDERFAPYHRVFNRFGFGLRLTAIILSHIYPLKNFLNEEGKPEVKIRKGRFSKKPTKRYLSLRRFQKSLGLAPSSNSSGDISKSKVVGGSKSCRKAFWQWVFTKLEIRKSRLKNDLGKVLGEILDIEKASGRPVALVRSRVAARAAKLLFKELVKELNDNK
jgi:transposase